MSTIVCLGGDGQFGLTTARLLADQPEIERVVVAGRSLAEAQAAADRLGPKAHGKHVDVDDPASLTDAVRGATVVVDTLWEPAKRQDPIVRAAAAAGAHYVDLAGRRPSADVDLPRSGGHPDGRSRRTRRTPMVDAAGRSRGSSGVGTRRIDGSHPSRGPS